MKIYLAGKWEEAETLRVYAQNLRDLGHHITMPWFDIETGEGIDKRSAAMNDVDGVRTANCCIFIFEKNLTYRGAYSELGMAIVLGKRIIIVGHGGTHNVFTFYPTIEKVTTWNEVQELLKGYHRA